MNSLLLIGMHIFPKCLFQSNSGPRGSLNKCNDVAVASAYRLAPIAATRGCVNGRWEFRDGICGQVRSSDSPARAQRRPRGRGMNGASVCGSRCRQWAVASAGPRAAASYAPIPSRRESCHDFRDHTPGPHNILHFNAPKLSHFSFNFLEHSHPLRRFMFGSNTRRQVNVGTLICTSIKIHSRCTLVISAAPYACA